MSYQDESKAPIKISNLVQWGYGVTGFAAINSFTVFVMFIFLHVVVCLFIIVFLLRCISLWWW